MERDWKIFKFVIIPVAEINAIFVIVTLLAISAVASSQERETLFGIYFFVCLTSYSILVYSGRWFFSRGKRPEETYEGFINLSAWIGVIIVITSFILFGHRLVVDYIRLSDYASLMR